MWFTDPLFFLNREQYTAGRVLRFSLAGMAHTIAAACQEVQITAGPLLELDVSAHVLGDYSPRIGDEIEGTAWIQGVRCGG